jgi:hypothetical protein
MLTRYFLALILTVFLYYFAYIPENQYFYVVSSFWSAGYIVALSFIKTRTTWIIAMIESVALATILCASIGKTLAHESQWLKTHYVDIMSYCYFLELVVIIAGGAFSGLSAINRLRLALNYLFKSLRSYLYVNPVAL